MMTPAPVAAPSTPLYKLPNSLKARDMLCAWAFSSPAAFTRNCREPPEFCHPPVRAALVGIEMRSMEPGRQIIACRDQRRRHSVGCAVARMRIGKARSNSISAPFPEEEVPACIRTFMVSRGCTVPWDAARATAPATTSFAVLSVHTGAGAEDGTESDAALAAVVCKQHDATVRIIQRMEASLNWDCSKQGRGGVQLPSRRPKRCQCATRMQSC